MFLSTKEIISFSAIVCIGSAFIHLIKYPIMMGKKKFFYQLRGGHGSEPSNPVPRAIELALNLPLDSSRAARNRTERFGVKFYENDMYLYVKKI